MIPQLQSGGLGVAGSNPATPTIFIFVSFLFNYLHAHFGKPIRWFAKVCSCFFRSCEHINDLPHASLCELRLLNCAGITFDFR